MSSTLFVDAIEPNLSSGVHIAGHVIQVVDVNTALPANTYSAFTTTAYADVKNMSLSITPKFATSKILVTMNFPFTMYNTSVVPQALLQVLRNTTQVWEMDRALLNVPQGTTFAGGITPISFVDYPNTNSSVTYKLQCRVNVSGTVARVGDNSGLGVGFGTFTNITLMEIAQ